ncbi:hypothetical protein EX895_005729 [Sporisorium graminicola]|uniref:CTLH domain-containing protein n=1 Tax=Sporisorium graminicola TaxID=280036 RepID=A0A4U7KP37_9BASI|nr:hypothetical protein EX895_005729 [Sporisorium graminicola]TKY85567.1 hypothetical protein EX895_005729 [Sporisorium graminicola]
MDSMTVDNATANATATGESSTAALAQTPSNAPNLDGILLLEAPFAKVPFDELRRQQKTQQRLIERELLFASTTFNEVSKTLSPPSSSAASATTTAGEVEKSLDAVLGRLKGLKRKLAPLSDAAKSSLRMAQSRTDHLSALHHTTRLESTEFAEWSKTRLDRMIVDYMLRRGYRQAAAELAQARGIQDLVDLQLFEEVARIEDSLCPPGWNTNAEEEERRPSCTLALAWCSENKATLRKIRTPLEFNLRLQEFVELTRVRTPESIKEAITYARRHLLPLVTTKATAGAAGDKEAEYDWLAAEAMRREVSRAMGLLACGPTSWAYADLYSLARWSMLRESFRACALQIHSLPPQPILHIALSAGLSSLKLPQCYLHSTSAVSAGKNTDCPICDTTGLGLLAQEVPWSHHQNSTLVCSHSGKIMDENDPPLALSNGRVYAQSTVLELVDATARGLSDVERAATGGAGQAEAKRLVRCPRTSELCKVDEVRKVFIS